MMAVSEMARQRSSIILPLVLLLSQFCSGRIHKLEIQNDVRKYIALSTFGFYEGGLLNVKLINFHAYPFKDSAVYGFSLDRTVSDAMNPYLDSHQEKCLLQEPIRHDNNGAVVYFTMDFKKKLLQVNCSKDLQTIHIYRNVSYIPALRAKRDSVVSQFSDTSLFHQRKKRDVEPETPHSPVAMPRSDFIRSRTLKKLLPSISKFLLKQASSSIKKDSGSVYRYSHEYKLQLSLLQGLGKLASNLEFQEQDLSEVLTCTAPYLSSLQPQPLQDACISTYKEVCKINEDTVWLKLAYVGNFFQDLKPPSSEFYSYQVPKQTKFGEEYQQNVSKLIHFIECKNKC